MTTTEPRRRTALRAGAEAPVPPETAAPPPPAPGQVPVDTERQERRAFADAVRMLRTGGQSLDLSERTLMVAAGIVAPLGLVFVLLGWYGAARTPNSFEQIPYLISGGLFGLGLVFLGAFFYFAHWLTELVKESRAGSAALLEAVNRLQESMASPAAVAGSAPSVAGRTDAGLVATLRGSMAHRTDCPVVADKDGLRAVTADDGLAPCKMCEPYHDDDSGS